MRSWHSCFYASLSLEKRSLSSRGRCCPGTGGLCCLCSAEGSWSSTAPRVQCPWAPWVDIVCPGLSLDPSPPQVGNSSIGWSLGYMLSLTNQIPAVSALVRLSIPPPAFMGLLAFFTASTLLSLAFLAFLCSAARTEKRSEHALEHAVDAD